MREIELSVIMINHDARALTAQAIDSIYAASPRLSFELVLVENGSNPLEEYENPRPEIKVLRHTENKGFGHACNLGAKAARGEYLLFLNNDTIMEPGTLESCLDYFRRHPRTGALGVRANLADGSLDPGCKRGFPTPANALYYFLGLDRRHPDSPKYGAYHQTFIDERAVREVDAVSGAFLMMPGALFWELGGFDEQFFMYGEDLDLCYRIKQGGHSVVYNGRCGMTHLKGQSGLRQASPHVIQSFYQSMEIFYRKHYWSQYPLALSLLVLLGIRGLYLLRRLSLLWARRGREAREGKVSAA